MSQPAGWYPQPDGTQRYWDGVQWTGHVAPAAGPAGSPQVADGPASQKAWYKKKRVIIPTVALVAIVGLAASQGGRGGETASPVVASASATQSAPAEVADDPVEEPTAAATDDPAEEPAVEEAEPETPSMTVSQEQAVRKAQDYLDYTSFSRSGLIKQLKFEGFSAADAKFGVDYLDVDWMKQAVLKAKDYLDYTSFSRSGLIKQLEFEGFTNEQARHGAKAVGL